MTKRRKPKPHIVGMVRDGACFFCGHDDVMQSAFTPVDPKTRKIAGDSLYLCDDCLEALAWGLVNGELAAKTKVCPKCKRHFNRTNVKNCTWCQVRLRIGLTLISKEEI